ncbi:RNA polymerase sigma factor [Chryseosolibacter indicus]|uniref:Sigma-70 family RNA polymerase sigma factor n=1 Tax=Chryseosolibacter indicus TaxID=2782351 RepID=A0ABS5VY00_9BACT|nr:sigma-70 family RNA polymerase sigma factor [Chryseosolibacter indicus]MBT1705938.1 sigma-70 family RNA polymerase sigma factor [Chryseosolibacter indicus]
MSDVINNERLRMLLRSHPGEAIELLHQFYSESLFKIAYRFSRDEEASRDIVQETFLQVWAKRKELSQYHEKSIEHYLVRTVRNMSVSHFKRKRHLNIDDFQFLKVYRDSSAPFEEALIEQELISRMRAFIMTFPFRERQCLLMKIDDELSLNQIAANLRISRKMVEKSQTSALKRLRKWAKDYSKENENLFSDEGR